MIKYDMHFKETEHDMFEMIFSKTLLPPNSKGVYCENPRLAVDVGIYMCKYSLPLYFYIHACECVHCSYFSAEEKLHKAL